jgi:hypothetical protein
VTDKPELKFRLHMPGFAQIAARVCVASGLQSPAIPDPSLSARRPRPAAGHHDSLTVFPLFAAS